MKDEHTLVAFGSCLTHGDGDTSRTEARWIEGKLLQPFPR